jgi:hypothetical protein
MAKARNKDNWDDMAFFFLVDMFASARKAEKPAESEMTAEEAADLAEWYEGQRDMRLEAEGI